MNEARNFPKKDEGFDLLQALIGVGLECAGQNGRCALRHYNHVAFVDLRHDIAILGTEFQLAELGAES